MTPISAGVLALSVLLAAPRQEGAGYFPQALYEASRSCGILGLGRRQAVMDDFSANWYGGHLRAAGEAPIFGNRQPTLRFTWLRTFDAPVVVRIDTTVEGAVLLTATELSGHGGYEPGTVARRIERRLSAEEAAALTRMVRETRILAEAPITCDLGLDGAQWIVESAGPAGYRFIERQSPEDGPVRVLGLHLIGLTGWTYESVY